MRLLPALGLLLSTVLAACAARTPVAVDPLSDSEMAEIRSLIDRFHDSKTPPPGWRELGGDEIRKRMVGHSYFGYETSGKPYRFVYEIFPDGKMYYGLGDLYRYSCDWKITQHSLNYDCSKVYHEWYVLTDGPHMVMVRYYQGRRYFNILEEITFSD